jgi:type IV pilus assembly protein PilC
MRIVMLRYEYKVADAKGDFFTGYVEAKDIKTAAQKLKEKDYFIIKLQPQVAKGIKVIKLKKPVNALDLARFSEQLSVMLGAGVPLVASLKVIEAQASNKHLKDALYSIAEQIKKGNTFHHSLEAYPEIFNRMTLKMIEAGEYGGVLGETASQLASHFQREHDALEKLKTAMTYPTLVLIVALISVFLMLILIIPTFAGILAGYSKELPTITKVFFSISNLLVAYWPMLLLVLFAFVIAFCYFCNTVKGKRILDLYLLRMPVWGQLQKGIIVARFCRTMGTLLDAGVPIIQSLDIAGQTTANSFYIDSLMKISEMLVAGKSLSKSLLTVDVFPEMVAHIVRIGEETAALDKLLIKLGDYYQKEVDMKINRLSNLFEPVLILVVGLIVAFVVIAMLLPMFQLLTFF